MLPTKAVIASVVLIVISVTSSLAFAQKPDCGKPQSTAEQAVCANIELANAEADMKKAYNSALALYLPTPKEKKWIATLPKPEGADQTEWESRMLNDLKTSQAAWLAYRKSACGTVEDMYDGGTISSVDVPGCKAEMTRARAKFLREYFRQ